MNQACEKNDNYIRRGLHTAQICQEELHFYSELKKFSIIVLKRGQHGMVHIEIANVW